MKLFQNKMTALRNVVVAATMIVATTTTFSSCEFSECDSCGKCIYP